MKYQVQFRNEFSTEWKNFRDKQDTLIQANRSLVDLLANNKYYTYGNPIEAIRIVSLLQYSDGDWHIKEVLQYKEINN